MIDYKSFLYDEFPELVKKVNPSLTALWGKMDAQQMIEHLAHVLSISNGRFEVTANAEPERLAYRKMRFFEKDVPFPQSVRVDIIPEEPNPYEFLNIDEAKTFLMKQLQRFYDYHMEHEGLQPSHPVFGPLSYEEWIQFHSRHIKHHLRQFGILVD
jgi:hypothetical protein